MAGLELVLLLLAVSAGLRVLADRLRQPYSALLVLGGLGLAVTPNLPRVELSPDVLFLIFIPPLLYWGAVSLPLRDFRRELGPILRLAVVMVLVSTAAVAALAHSIDPAFTWAAAFTLGAIVSPPDPVAVVSLMRSPALHAPRPIESILEGEGLLNDATALVAYRFAVAAAVTGTFSPLRASWQFLLAAVGGLAIGLAVGFIAIRLHRLTRSVPVADNTVSLLTPFAAFLPADLIGVSGVISVVVAGMYVSRQATGIGGPETRLQNQSMWSVVTFLLESLVFILVGLELPYVTRALGGYPLVSLFKEAALVCLCVIVVRMLWVVPSTYIGRTIGAWLRGRPVEFPPWRWILFIGWSGVRGGDSLVIALALPLTTAAGAPFPARAQIVFITFCVILLTLVVQGPTLAPFARLLGLRADRRGQNEEAHARLSATEAGLNVLTAPEFANSRFPEIARYLRQRHRQRARRWAALEAREMTHAPNEDGHEHFVAAPSHDAGTLDEGRAAEYRRVRSAMIRAEREALLDLRDRDIIGDDVLRRVQRDLDLEMILLDSREPVVEPSSEAPWETGSK
jgi:CPA1 family monovalent cation:H+ antiporter